MKVLIVLVGLLASLTGQPDQWTEQGLMEASQMFGVPYQELYDVAQCESGSFRPEVVYGPARGKAGEQGMLQYVDGASHSLWLASPWAEFSPYDPHAAAFVTAWHWSQTYLTRCHWSCWRLLYDRGRVVCG